MKSTLVIAQSTADDVTSAARKKAELIIEDAEIQAKNRTNEALNEVRNIMKEYDYLKKEIFIFKTRYESFIKAQLISLEEFYKDYENKNQVKKIDVDEESIDENLDEIDHLGA